ncbi:YicC family protein [Pseudoalteromonas sp. L23]|uniref:YicC/YloC family endoribonuclease n=1 Tax=unclassified Pseudoalteromonas TaxID=194690 RepID=UPI001F16D623|nr:MULTISPECIES: YicC/YloC family endoribonuclease [unclassified Pseudoalteromonas]MCF2825947.1 YicC family protein [Pseudoalteromonas sp. OF5H-5]MCF2829969.1 YicC family protein [Pseudoalteromonas sp. DL2-H6]MCF2925394.1 YicC family protein [Pseudoalteromonas sp. DL2-H1]MCF7515476.1 YicC family protein [Pseudoalteromonas sp. L7]MCF7527644.1 YicC family protein [Pseudoalteromonas sp. L23]
MIHSMTAYARKEVKGDWGTGVWEIRSVNQRYLETFIRAPEQFRGLEPVIRERLRKHLQRGKVEVFLKFTANPAHVGQLTVNESLAKQLVESAKWLQSQSGGDINPVDILRWPGVMEAEEVDLDTVNSELLGGFDELIEDFKAARASEGENLETMLITRLEGILEQVAIVEGYMPEVTKWQREKLSQKLEELKTDIDEGRLEQELIYLAQKQDVAEELDRLKSHVKETHKILKKGGACGRRLDFMMQEFNRESNTLASKSINSEITNAAVELKVLIEQMREQIQNIE